MKLNLTIPCPYCGKPGKHNIEEYRYSMAFHPVVDIEPRIKVFKLEEVK